MTSKLTLINYPDALNSQGSVNKLLSPSIGMKVS